MSKMSRQVTKPPRLHPCEIAWTRYFRVTEKYAESLQDRALQPEALSIRVEGSPPAGRPVRRSDRRTSAKEPSSWGPLPPEPQQSRPPAAMRRRVWWRRSPERRVAFGHLPHTNGYQRTGLGAHPLPPRPDLAGQLTHSGHPTPQ